MATRDLTFLLAVPERRILHTIARRLPRAIVPDHLTALGVAAALGTGAAYALSSLDPRWLWAASAGLVLHWLGDSLDGTLARVRRIERPRYGYYLDHLVDAVSTAAIGLGMGLSPYVDGWVALGLVVAYLVLSINVYLEASVFDVFQLGYGRIGPTETRMILIGANTVLAVFSGPLSRLPVALPTIVNGTFLILLAGMGVVLALRVARNLTALARQEPGAKAGATPAVTPPVTPSATPGFTPAREAPVRAETRRATSAV